MNEHLAHSFNLYIICFKMKIKVKFIDDLKPFKLLYFCEMNDNPTFTYLLVKVLWHGLKGKALPTTHHT